MDCILGSVLIMDGLHGQFYVVCQCLSLKIVALIYIFDMYMWYTPLFCIPRIFKVERISMKGGKMIKLQIWMGGCDEMEDGLRNLNRLLNCPVTI